jgi:hypothetical protein
MHPKVIWGIFLKVPSEPGNVWHRPVILALGRLRQEKHEFQASLGYIVRPQLKKDKDERKTSSVWTSSPRGSVLLCLGVTFRCQYVLKVPLVILMHPELRPERFKECPDEIEDISVCRL